MTRTLYEQRDVQTTGIGATSSFKIKASGVAFDILSSGLYSNKIAAILRELSANAADSHAAAGQERPFEVDLPGKFRPTFAVRDFGTGLTRDQFAQVYTTYFESTKLDDDRFTGHLGLGSKTPFSYASAFNVRSRTDGEEVHYSCFLGADGLPTFTELGAVPTTEGNGLEVSFPVKPEDFHNFKHEAKNVLRWFSPQPVVSGLTAVEMDRSIILEDTLDVDGTPVKLQLTGDVSGPHLIMGNVLYPIDRSQVAINSDLGYTSFIMEVPRDSVSHTASRESLKYDGKTKDIIERAARAVHKRLVDEVTSYARLCNCIYSLDLLDKSIRAGELYPYHNLVNRERLLLAYEGRLPERWTRGQIAAVSSDRVIRVPYRRVWLMRGSRGRPIDDRSKFHMPAQVYVGSAPKNLRELNAEKRKVIGHQPAGTYHFNEKLYVENIDDYRTLFHGRPMVMVSDIVEEPTEPKERPVREARKVYTTTVGKVLKGLDTGRGIHTVSERVFDSEMADVKLLSAKPMAIETKRWIYKGEGSGTISAYLRAAIRENLLKEEDVVYIFNGTWGVDLSLFDWIAPRIIAEAAAVPGSMSALKAMEKVEHTLRYNHALNPLRIAGVKGMKNSRRLADFFERLRGAATGHAAPAVEAALAASNQNTSRESVYNRIKMMYSETVRRDQENLTGFDRWVFEKASNNHEDYRVLEQHFGLAS